MRTTSVRTEAGTIASITAHGPTAHPAAAPDRGTCPVLLGSDLIDLLGSTASHIAHTRTLLGVHASSSPIHVPLTLLLLTDRYLVRIDHPDCKNMHGTMHIDQVVRRPPRRPIAAACYTGSFPMAPVEASLVGACHSTGKSTCQAPEHGINAQEHGGGCERAAPAERICHLLLFVMY